MRVVRMTELEPQPATVAIFEGDVQVADFLGAAGSEALNGFSVTFRDGGRTVWHAHSTDQVLLITAGSGVVEDEQERRDVQTGDVVLVPAGDRHWHGSTPGGEMTHLSFMPPGETTLG